MPEDESGAVSKIIDSQSKNQEHSLLIVGRCSQCGRPWGTFRIKFAALSPHRIGSKFCDDCWDKIVPLVESMLAVKFACEYCREALKRADDQPVHKERPANARNTVIDINRKKERERQCPENG